MFDYSPNVYFSPCMHRRVTTEITGSKQFIEGVMFDNLEERLICLDCLEYVSEEEVRAAWGQTPMPKQEKSRDND